MPIQIALNDIIRLRKKHPCGSFDWRVVRLGVDIGLVCEGCGRRVLLSRSTFNKRYKTTIRHAADDPAANPADSGS